jgi:hypothetical protein
MFVRALLDSRIVAAIGLRAGRVVDPGKPPASQ